MKVKLVNAAPGAAPQPFQQPREIIRAVNAIKLEKLFSTPFVESLELADSCLSLARHPLKNNFMYGTDAQGYAYQADLQTKSIIKNQLHSGFATGIAPIPKSMKAFTVSSDKSIKLWDPTSNSVVASYIHKQPLNSIHHHRASNQFATSSSQIDIWDHSKANPIMTLTWGAETIQKVKYNMVETSLLASVGSDRTICLYDTRTQLPISKVILAMRSNDISWNPMEAFNFAVANEDHNIYTYDMRNLSYSTNIHKDHVSAVYTLKFATFNQDSMSIDYSPAGNLLCSGSYDRTVRIFDVQKGRSIQMYHTKRMQRVFAVQFTTDANYVISGSDECNIRVWKTDASKPLGTHNAKYTQAVQYNKTLIQKYQHLDEVKRIQKSNHAPKSIKSALKLKHVGLVSTNRKRTNVGLHSEGGAVVKPDRKRHILAVEK